MSPGSGFPGGYEEPPARDEVSTAHIEVLLPEIRHPVNTWCQSGLLWCNKCEKYLTKTLALLVLNLYTHLLLMLLSN